MALAIREQQQSTAAYTDFVFTLGAGTQVGDLVVVIAANDFYTAAQLTTPTGTAVSSWTLQHTMDGGTNDNHAKVWTGPVTTGGAQTVDTNWASTDEERFVAVFVISGGATYADAASADTDTTSTNFVAPSVTPAAGSTDSILLCLWGYATGDVINFTVPGSMTAYTEVDFTSFVTFRAASEVYTSSSATGTRTATGSAARDGFGVSVIVSGAGTAVAAPTPTWQPPGLGGPFRIPSPWWGTDGATAAGSSVAEGGIAGVAGATTGTAVKVAAAGGSCTVGFAPLAIDGKAAPQGGASTAGASETAIEKKSAPETGTVTAGAGGTGVETTALTAASKPAVTIVSAPRAAAYGRVQPALVLNGFVHGTTIAAEQGVGAVALAATATAVKVAKVAGTCAVAGGVTGAARKLAPAIGVVSVGTAATATEKKLAVEIGAATVGTALTRAGAVSRAETGTASVGSAATGTAKKVAGVVGACTVGAAGTGTARKVAKAVGIGAVGTAETGAAKKAAPLTGAVLAGAVITGAARKTFAESGVTAAGFRAYGSVSVWGPPPGLTATPVSATQIDLSWIAVALAAGYDIERDGVVIATDVVGTSYSDTSLTPGATYTYRARSVHV